MARRDIGSPIKAAAAACWLKNCGANMPMAAAGNMFEYREESASPAEPPNRDGLPLTPGLDVFVIGGDMDIPRSSSSFIIVAGARPEWR